LAQEARLITSSNAVCLIQVGAMKTCIAKQETIMGNEPVRTDNGPLTQLVRGIGRAAMSGWGQTARLALLILIGAIAVAFILVAYR